MAMTACAAKLSSNAICRSEKGRFSSAKIDVNTDDLAKIINAVNVGAADR